MVMMLTITIATLKVFRRLEEERLSQLQAMAALYLQVIEFMMMMMMMIMMTF